MSLINAQKRRMRRLLFAKKALNAVLFVKAYFSMMLTVLFLADKLPIWMTCEIAVVVLIIESIIVSLASGFVNRIYEESLAEEDKELCRLVSRHNRLTAKEV